MASREEISSQDLQALAEFRYNIRRFLRASEQILKTAGLKPQQYQLMLHVKALPEGAQSTISQVAERLQIHNGAQFLNLRFGGTGGSFGR